MSEVGVVAGISFHPPPHAVDILRLAQKSVGYHSKTPSPAISVRLFQTNEALSECANDARSLPREARLGFKPQLSSPLTTDSFAAGCVLWVVLGILRTRKLPENGRWVMAKEQRVRVHEWRGLSSICNAGLRQQGPQQVARWSQWSCRGCLQWSCKSRLLKLLLLAARCLKLVPPLLLLAAPVRAVRCCVTVGARAESGRKETTTASTLRDDH